MDIGIYISVTEMRISDIDELDDVV